MSVALRRKRQVKELKMGSQHLPSFTFYAILDPLVRPSQSIVGCSDLKVEEDLPWKCQCFSSFMGQSFALKEKRQHS